MLLAESLVLVALDPSGEPSRPSISQSRPYLGVKAALVTELAFEHHLVLDDGRIRLTGSRPSHPLLARALDAVAIHEGKRLTSRLDRIKHAGFAEVVESMAAEGRLVVEKRRLRGVRYPVRCLDEQAAVLHRLRRASSTNDPMDPPTAALLALASASGLFAVVVPEGTDVEFARQRIRQAAEHAPAAAAVRQVLAAASLALSNAATVGGTFVN